MSATLSPALVRAILRTAKVDPFDFLRAIEESNAPAKTELPSAPLLRGHGRAWEASTTSDDEDQGPISRVA